MPLVGLLLALAVGLTTPVGAATAPVGFIADASAFTNDIVLENRRPGSTEWQVTKSANDVALQIAGYADRTSLNKGSTIKFHVTVNPAQQYRIEYWRMGWYGGRLGRRVGVTGWINGTRQSSCMPPGDEYVQYGLIECNWTAGAALTVPSDWVSGVYLAKLINQQGYQRLVPFVVRDDGRAAPILIAHTSSTYQAYNEWPADGVTGKSLYRGSGPRVIGSDGVQAVKVSFNRPYSRGRGAGDFFAEAIHADAWFERNGYDVTYADSVDIHSGAVDPANYSVFVSPSHDEYWSKEMYDRLELSHQGSTDLAFLTANNIYWQARFEPSTWDGTANRVMVVYKNAAKDPVKGELATIRWRELGRAEQQLLGSMFITTIGPDADWVVYDASAPIYKGTGVVNGTKIPKMVGVEGDMIFPDYPMPSNPRVFYQLSQSPFQTRDCGCTGPTNIQQGTLYQASNGNWVLNTGTFNWPKGLASPAYLQPQIQRMTTNLLATMLDAALVADFRRMSGSDRYATAAIMATDTFAPGVGVAYVASGENFPDALASGPAAGHGGGPVLLSRATSLPSATATALSRLRPDRIVVAGGPSVVSDAVLEQLRAYAVSGRVDRIAGTDRYQTSARISASTFAPGVPVAYVATGLDFADALSGSAAGAAVGGPVLLTRPTSLSAATSTELARLKPQRIVVLGGPSAVSDSVAGQLAAIAPTTRAAGPNRYETAVAVSQDGYAAHSGPTVYIAHGLNFPDGLAGAPAAALAPGPLLLVGSSLSPQVATEIVRLNPSKVVVLGSAGAVSDAVLSQLRALFSSSTYTEVTSYGTPKP